MAVDAKSAVAALAAAKDSGSLKAAIAAASFLDAAPGDDRQKLRGAPEDLPDALPRAAAPLRGRAADPAFRPPNPPPQPRARGSASSPPRRLPRPDLLPPSPRRSRRTPRRCAAPLAAVAPPAARARPPASLTPQSTNQRTIDLNSPPTHPPTHPTTPPTTHRQSYDAAEFPALAAKYEKLAWRIISKPGGATVKPDEFYTLAALAAQATAGDVAGERPMWAEKGGLDFEGRARWDAWAAVKGTPSAKAKADFVKHYYEFPVKALYSDARGAKE
jgi:acyl-CoA-binding protein